MTMTDEERRERRRKYQQEYRAKNRDKLNAQARAWKERNREEYLERRRELDRIYREKHPDRVRASKRAWVVRNRDKQNEGVRAWKKRNPDRVRALDRAYRARRAIRKATSIAQIGEALNAALGRNDIYAAANAAVPLTLPRDVRQDVISDLVLAVLEGTLAESEIAGQARRFLSRHYASRDWHTTKSLDATVPGMERRTYHELIEG